MSKIGLIIGREYSTRVRKKSFIIVTLLAPILMAALTFAPALLLIFDKPNVRTIALVDKSNKFVNEFKNSETLKFVNYPADSIENIKSNLTKSDYYALLILPKNVEKEGIELLSDGQTDIETKSSIEKIIEQKLHAEKLMEFGISRSKLDSTQANIRIKTVKVQSDGSEEVSSTAVIMAIGFIAGFIIYIFIFVYGAQVMRAVLEEKTNRVVEVLVSSVKPFELMMGKVVGIALVALTQVALWLFLTTAILTVVQPILGLSFGNDLLTEQTLIDNQELANQNAMIKQITENESVKEALNTLFNLPVFQILFSFLFYFMGGYLLYSSLFAALVRQWTAKPIRNSLCFP